MTPEDIVHTISEGLEQVFTEEKSWGRGGSRTHTWAGGWKPCRRQMALDLTNPEDREVDAAAYARMSFGGTFENAIVSKLILAGEKARPPFTVEALQERFEHKGKSDGPAAGKVALTGKVDGFLRFTLDYGFGVPETLRVPYECKAGESVKRVRTLEDMLKPGTWASHYVYQLLAYLFATGSPWGIFVLHSGGLPRLIPVALEDHLDKTEAFLSAAETAWQVKNEGAPLPLFTDNPEHCRRCDHRGKSCAPPWDNGTGPYVSTDPELVELVEVVAANGDAAQVHRKSWSRLKQLCHGKALVIIGDRTITGRRWGKGWKIEIEKGERP